MLSTPVLNVQAEVRIVVVASATAQAQMVSPKSIQPSPGATPTTVPSQAELVALYAAKSDAQLSQLSAQWPSLPLAERRVLLREVKLRMARRQGPSGVRIRTERRYGRVVRQADGSVVRIERRVVRVRPQVSAGEAGQHSMPRVPRSGHNRAAGVRVIAPESVFGIGFERRSAGQAATDSQHRSQLPAPTAPTPAP